ncbi:MAG: hypothetical protein M1142_06205 [Patescibacteria group bacterium]|nr:hypothetical protein [Patescibacteria group bacterium]
MERVETISVEIKPDDVPDSSLCPNCGPGAPVEKVLRGYRVQAEGVTIVNTEPIPAFLCQRCGTDGFLNSLVVGLPLDRALLTKLTELDLDQPGREVLVERILVLEKHSGKNI